MIGWIETKALYRLRNNELYGLQKLYFRTLTCPDTDPADLPAIHATLTAIENELSRRNLQPFPSL